MLTRPNEIPVAAYSILDDAQIILENLKQQEKLMEHNTDLGAPPAYGTSEAAQKKYNLARNVSLFLTDSKLSEARFYAAADLINHAVDMHTMNKPSSVLKLDFRCTTIFMKMHADYHSVESHIPAGTQSKLVAPIAKVPFDAIQHEISSFLKIVLTGWHEHAGDKTKLAKKAEDKGYVFHSHMRAFEKICKEVMKDFAYSISSHDDKLYLIDKVEFNHALQLLSNKVVPKAALTGLFAPAASVPVAVVVPDVKSAVSVKK